jgi:hypothetical protein
VAKHVNPKLPTPLIKTLIQKVFTILYRHVYVGTNEKKQAKDVTLEKDCMSFCPKETFSYK